jgi:group II intron reverse transcriptase/maturase
VRFYSLYDKVWRTDILWEAWRQVKANQGAPGVDGKAIDEIVVTGQEAGMIKKLQEALRAKRSCFAPVRLVEIPKPRGGTRPLGIATGEDRIVQTAMKLVLEPIFEADFHDCSYGYRPKRDAKQASIAIREDLYNRAWGVVEIDLQAYFTSIPHGKLLKRITQRIADGSMLKLIKQTLKVGGKDRGQVVATTVGVPQGSPISPLYSNISLNLLDHLWHRRGDPEKLGATLHRYADDAIVVCRRSPQPVLTAFEAIATRMELTLNREKTRVTRLTDGVDFVGFNVVKRQSPSSGKNTIYLFPAKSAQQKMRNRLKSLPSRRAPISPKECVEMVNPIVTGWVNSFRHTNASQAFRGLQRFVNIRFRRYLTQRSKGRGFGWKRFPNSTLYARGLVSIGSGRRTYVPKPAHGVRGRLSDRRTREHCTYGGMGREWGTAHDGAREALPWGNPQQLIGPLSRR